MRGTWLQVSIVISLITTHKGTHPFLAYVKNALSQYSEPHPHPNKKNTGSMPAMKHSHILPC